MVNESPLLRGLILVAALLMAALTARLGLWQLDRADQKRAILQAEQAQSQAPLLAAAELAATPEAVLLQRHRRVRLEGRWLPQHTIYLDNRQMGGRPGFFVLTPLQLNDGRRVLVQRGWLPRDQLDRTRLPPYTTETGGIQVFGRVVDWPSRLAQLGPDVPGPIRQNLDREAYAAEVGAPLAPLSIQQLPGPGEALSAGGLLRDWPQPVADVAKHQGYATQWFVFCAMIAGLYVWFQLLLPWRRSRR